MVSRLTASLLTVVLGAGAVLASPVACGAVCSLSRQAECCKRGTLGITAQPCCEGPQRLANSSAPATTERGGANVRIPLVSLEWVFPAAPEPPHGLRHALLAVGIGPPGRG